MSTINLLMYGIVLFAGFAMGCLYFSTLWWTVKRMGTIERPAMLFLGSFVMRTGLVLAGFFILAGGRWQRLVIGLFGFLVARFVIVNYYRRDEGDILV